jgi:hypothetical protein
MLSINSLATENNNKFSIPCDKEMISYGLELFRSLEATTNIEILLENQTENSSASDIKMTWKAPEDKYNGSTYTVTMVATEDSCFIKE